MVQRRRDLFSVDEVGEDATMFWAAEEKETVADEKKDRIATKKEVPLDKGIETADVLEGSSKRYSEGSNWSVIKWLQNFCHRNHSAKSLNSSKLSTAMTRRTPTGTEANYSLSQVQKKSNKVVPRFPRICDRHLQLEPLCCFSSCLIRGGCTAVAVFQYTYVLFTLIAIILRLHNSGLSQFWQPFKMSYISIVTHNILLCILLVYDLITVMITTILLRGLFTFDRQNIRLHLHFDYFALAFNVAILVLFFPALFLPNSEARNFANIILSLCFITQIPLQIWAITVVRSCLEFFVLIHVLVEMAQR
uniref:DUF4220 domain-containing protein n=1 Tax=Setaria digitata TaxID=48799 RepID=A0A915Q3C6_9BILA